MADDDDASHKRQSDQIQKQKEALEKSKSVVQRPAGNTKSQQPEKVITNSPPPITYPEFAPAQQVTAPPLVSLRRLLLVLYLSAGTAATLYLVSKVGQVLQTCLTRAVIPATAVATTSDGQKRVSSACSPQNHSTCRSTFRYSLTYAIFLHRDADQLSARKPP
jgi:hypothetical protein